MMCALGKTLQGWNNEKWLDTRNKGGRDIMTKRIQTAKDKGCDAIDAVLCQAGLALVVQGL